MLKKIVAALILAAAGAASTFAWWLHRELHTPFYGAPEEAVLLEIPRGANSNEIADLLVEAKVLRSRLPFKLYLRRTGESRRLQAGEYRFAGPATPSELVRRLVKGDVYFLEVTIPEGLTARETVALIAARQLGDLGEMERLLGRTDWIEDLDPGARTLEGYLFPSTYRFQRGASSEQILRAMTRLAHRRITELLAAAPDPAGREVRRIITLASIIEKETGREEERGLVASVLANRLRLRMPLACDPTIIYALKLEGKFDGNLRKADLAMDSPYNTYLYPGLPPGPITNPGAASIEAAIAPPVTDYLFFVSKNDGTHHFSSDYRAHTEAVARYQKGGRTRSSR